MASVLIAVIALVLVVVGLGVAFIILSQSHPTISPSPKQTQTPTPTIAPTSATTAPTLSPTSSNSTPSVPTFSVTLTNTSYTVPTTYSTDPQTGDNITKAGYFVNAENLTFIIRNQPNVNYYLIRWTTPYATNWTYLYEAYPVNATLAQSSSSETIMNLSGTYGQFLVYPTNQWVNGYTFSDSAISQFQNIRFESGATIEFQMQAVNGQYGLVTDYNSQGDLISFYHDIFGPASAWSQTQTVTIP